MSLSGPVMELDCSFQKLVGGNCGLSSRNPSKTTVVSLLSCKKDISGHKRCFGINDIDSEVELILACASIFSLPSDVGDRTVCPSYRYSLAIGWRRGSHHVLYRHVFQTTFKKGNREKQRPTAVLAKRFQELSFAELEYLLPQDLVYMTDARICCTCRSTISVDDIATPSKTPEDPTQDITSGLENTSLNSSTLDIPVTPGKSFYVQPSSECSSQVSFDDIDTEHALSKPVEALNTYLVSRDLSPIRSQLTIPWETAEACSSSALHETLSTDKDSDDEIIVHETLMSALAECYYAATCWETRRQILSLMADKVPFKRLLKWIPDLIKYCYTEAKRHCFLHGAEAFDDLLEVIDVLGDAGEGMGWMKRQQHQLRESKRYLKSDYKVHICTTSKVVDHCRKYALSDPKEPAFQSPGDHEHTEVCDRCELLKTSIQAIEAGPVAQNDNLTPEVKEELSFTVKQAKSAILAWKSHLLNSVNQDAARLEVLDSLDESSVLLVQDWAMKYLPRKYRESQSDWYGKRGIPWHITVATRKSAVKYEMLTFVDIFPSCSQDSCAVIAVMADVVKQLMEVMPTLTSVYYRQDNAACYHCGATITCGLVLHDQVSIKRLDFSDPQGGKGPCDRKAATIKSHMRIHLNSGNDIETPDQMKDAILSSGGVPSVHVTLCEPMAATNITALKIPGVSRLNNIKFENDGIRFWRACDIGPGKFIPRSKLNLPSSPNYSQTCSFAAIKQRCKPTSPTETEDEDNQEETSPTNVDDADRIFMCPEEGCTQTFLRHSSMQRHLDCGRHKRELERNTLLDKAALTYAEALEGQTAGFPQLETCTMPVSAHNDSNRKMGWALKTSGSKLRFTSTQVSYLTSKFKIGEENGQKANPASVARAMRTGKDTNGNPLFTYEYFFTSTQIASFFSRLASKKSLANEGEVVMDDVNSAASETEMEKLTSVAALEAGLTHPITYDTYNLCDMSSKS
ncbi:hypothetical protein P5673_010917 [Acropora cervicornis]|uniref:C2H2-type domain-containing protein n=1 Tax=Acropora cervicornis TaxID=6130 RepID=A0AAD9QQP7_ACRCE|nr:hypothetical protein P5673_010917 [Acropora cervicornis]